MYSDIEKNDNEYSCRDVIPAANRNCLFCASQGHTDTNKARQAIEELAEISELHGGADEKTIDRILEKYGFQRKIWTAYFDPRLLEWRLSKA